MENIHLRSNHHSTYQSFATQPCNNLHLKEGSVHKNREAPILAACRTGNKDWFSEERSKYPNCIHREYLSGKTGKYVSLIYMAD